MAYFFAEKMTYCECMMPREIGWDVMQRLGSLQFVHMQQMAINYENPFIKSYKRCDEAVHKALQIRNFITSIKKDFKTNDPTNYKDALRQFENQIQSKNIQGYLYMNEVEEQIQQIHTYLINQKKQLENVTKEINDSIITAALLITIAKSPEIQQICRQRQLNQSGFQNPNIFQYKCMVINQKDQMPIKKGLFRISRGNAWVTILEIPIEEINTMFKKQFDFLKDKLACIIIYQRGQGNFLNNKITRFLSCVQSTIIDTPPQRWKTHLEAIQDRMKQMSNLQDLTVDAIQRYLHKLYEQRGNSSISNLTFLELYARKQRQIYHALACTHVSNSFLHFNMYIPSKHLPLNIRPNEHLPPLIINIKEQTKNPPSKFDMPTIMQMPQAILNTYGVPSYNQFNPAVLYIVTFGFFIGVMFGDIGHMLMAFPLLIALNANIWAWTVVFWMGYCGLIYNQFLGLNFGLFSSCYNSSNQQGSTSQTIIYTQEEDCVYPIGVDSIWKVSLNQMQFVNSLKMKLAVILGVAHMMLGLFIKFINNLRRKQWLDILTLTIPQTIFMITTFAYMDFLIIFKWFQVYQGDQTRNAPSIISTMIAIFANFGDPNRPLFWSSEVVLQRILLGITFAMIPIMLLAKPLIILLKKKCNPKQQSLMVVEHVEHQFVIQDEKISQNYLSQQNKALRPGQSIIYEYPEKQQHQVDESMQQIFVHQFIQTIQYVLGSVSNTASYLRLWALSLAHGQLSQVIFSLIMQTALQKGYNGIFGLILAFPFFFASTFGILICMDSMQCFLHSLRLHWVEFQNKFYSGNGYEFIPYAFKGILDKKQ